MNKKKRLITVYIFAFMSMFALSSTMFSTVLPKIIDKFSISLTTAGLLPMCSSIGNLAATLLTGIIGDRFQKSRFIALLCGLMGLMLFCIAVSSSFIYLLISFTLLGIVTSSLNLMLTAYISDLYGEHRSRYINLLHLCFGIGSLLGPLYPLLIERIRLSWSLSYVFLSAAVLIITIAYSCLLFKNGEPAVSTYEVNANPKAEISYRSLLTNPGVILLCITGALYMGGHQNMFSTWFQTYLQRTDAERFSEVFTSLCMTIYWIGMAFSRLIGAILSERYRPAVLMRAGAAIGVCALAIGLLINSNGAWYIFVALLGVSTGIIYPMIFSVSCEILPTASARISSLIGIFTSLGGILFNYLAGYTQDRFLKLTMWIPVAMLLIVVILLSVMIKRPASQID